MESIEGTRRRRKRARGGLRQLTTDSNLPNELGWTISKHPIVCRTEPSKYLLTLGR